MKRIKNYVLVLAVLMMSMSFTMTAYADSVSGAGGTGQGNITGTNVYTFSYIYDGTIDAIVLKVDTTKPVKAFGNTCTHTFGPGDTTTLNTNYPQLGSSLESAIATMNAYGGYNLSADAAKASGEDIEVWAVARGLVPQEVGKADVCLVGPQIRFDIKAIAKELPGVPVEMIEMKSYGTMNGKAIIQQAKALYEKSKA